ncbi:hypothetical protein [Mesobacillus jeotgali]|uniref:hypothetical protein n=1 Tax=Mesobacillus jeotgali TaxID=129985 RepID=UPI002227D976|nr:hypothetical protein [Mesobacillus jeotgali]UYZ22985.1 hypothetical protein FOF60_05370 [Mesobacillus jeotgali]
MKSGKAVRTQSNFRQVQREKGKSCPNPEQLQTGSSGKVEKLSELGATSDRFSVKKWKSCPNPEQLQTGSAEKAEKLSEPRATSDRFS